MRERVNVDVIDYFSGVVLTSFYERVAHGSEHHVAKSITHL